MRVSAENHDRADVWLDGKLVSYCIEADDEAGYVHAFVSPLTEDGDTGEFLTYRAHGVVMIERHAA